ncbi:MAG: aminopeptidase [Deltaproteobacteria bacterium]|nr:aminopeptidase [Deltaproteobacteria bacterium]
MSPRARRLGFLLAAGLAAATLLPSCGARYVVVSAVYQAEMLARREPVDDLLASGTLSAGEEQRLRLFQEVKAFGRDIGLSATDNYSGYSRTWTRTIWNVSACPPLSFEPRTWWFPIVGTVPYLGYFSNEEAHTARVRLQAEGYEVHMRVVNAYSTLGWFKDPILPAMMSWTEPQVAETVLHELAHATLWIPGSVAFNESFANVVGQAAGDQFLVHKYGQDSAELALAREADADWLAFRAILQGLYAELDAVYTGSLPETEKSRRKEELYASLDDRVLASPISNKARYLQVVRTQAWNNPRLMQFRTYNSGEEEFAALMAACDGDILTFITRVREITRGQHDPFAALRAAVTVP